VVVVDRVDLREVDEVLDVDRARALGVERVELVRGDDHVPVLGELEPLDDLLVRDVVAGFGVHALLLDAVARLLVELVEPHGLSRHR
jgi:hypothetical protein